MITIFLPRFNVTVGSMLIRDVMSDSFYINGAIPPLGKVVLSHAIERTIKGKNFIFSVSDSISTTEDEETAARRFAHLIKKSHDTILSSSQANFRISLEDFVTAANGEMRSFSTGNSSDYGASFAMLAINAGVATMVNAGDVRGFAFRDNLLIPLTKSHVYDKLFASGVDEAPLDNKPEKYVGSAFGGDSINPHFSDPVPVDMDDVFLMCSNGLTDIISEQRIEYILSLSISDEKMVHRLISEAVASGAEDNITIMLVRNGGKPVKSTKKSKGFLKLIILVVVFAVLAAFITSMFHSCSQKPNIEEEDPTPETIVIEPENNDFAISENPKNDVPPDENFILREPSSNE